MKEWLYVWDIETGKMLRKFRLPRDHRCRLLLSSDGRTLATSELIYSNDYGEDTVRLFDIETGKQVLGAGARQQGECDGVLARRHAAVHRRKRKLWRRVGRAAGASRAGSNKVTASCSHVIPALA